MRSTSDYAADIYAALATQGGHLSIGRGGFTLHYGDGAMLAGYGVAGQLIVRMRRFGLGLAFNCENKDGRILKLTAFEKRLSISELGL